LQIKKFFEKIFYLVKRKMFNPSVFFGFKFLIGSSFSKLYTLNFKLKATDKNVPSEQRVNY